MTDVKTWREFESACQSITHADLSKLIYGILEASDVPFFTAIKNDTGTGWIISSSLRRELDVIMVLYSLCSNLGENKVNIVSRILDILIEEELNQKEEENK